MSEQKRMLLAVILSGLVIFGWQIYQNKFNPVPITTVEEEIKNTSEVETSETTLAPLDQSDLKDFVIANDNIKFDFSSDLSIHSIQGNGLANFSDIVGSIVPFSISVNGNPLNFTGEMRDSVFRGVSENTNTRLSIDENDQLAVNLKGPLSKYKLNLNAPKQQLGNKSRSFAYFIDGDAKFLPIGKKNASVSGQLKWIAIDFNYHILVITFEEKIMASLSIDGENLSVTTGDLESLDFKVLYTLKNYDKLVKLGNNLKAAVGFGLLSILAVPILRILNFCYKFTSNYGVAIILLTLLIRLLISPLHIQSMKSMKKMQLVQPKLNALKEKYKDDPQQVNLKTMELFRTEKINPMGGCLPIFLQMPIFIALYRVLNQAVELVNAPFFGWIHDLSVKDPYYILPIFMTLTMLGQQLMMPAAMDAKQKRMMLLMPLFFGFFMKDLPSGLALYFSISSLLGMIQQKLVAVFFSKK